MGWYNHTGQGLGRPLAGVLEFCDRNKLPLLTSIVCATGTNSPSPRGIAAMQEVLNRHIDVQAEQEAAFRFDWQKVGVLGLETESDNPSLCNLHAISAHDFQPEQQGIFFFSSATSRDACLNMMERRTLSIVHVQSNCVDGRAEGGEGRLLGITELNPVAVPAAGASDVDPNGNQVRYGLAIKRAWRFMKPPLAISTLTDNRVRLADAGVELVALSVREHAEIAQHRLVEVPVSGQARYIPPYVPPPPAIHTYMVVCHEMMALKAVGAEPGHRLVKIGVSNDKDRRLQELNGNHIAIIFGVSFTKFSEGTWGSQYEALQVERRAHEWCHVNGKHASGEYFYLREEQLALVGAIVFKENETGPTLK